MTPNEEQPRADVLLAVEAAGAHLLMAAKYRQEAEDARRERDRMRETLHHDREVLGKGQVVLYREIADLEEFVRTVADARSKFAKPAQAVLEKLHQGRWERLGDHGVHLVASGADSESGGTL